MAKSVTLTAEQTEFLEKYLKGKNRIAKATLTSDYKDFLGRQAKAQAAIDVLTPGSADRMALEARMAGAQGLADNGKFSAAYDALNSVKKDARKAANGFKSSLTPASIKAEIAFVQSGLVDLASERNARAAAIEDKFDEALTYLRGRNPVSSTSSREEAFARLRDLQAPIQQARTTLEFRKAELDINGTEMAARVKAFDLASKVSDIEHKIAVLDQTVPGSGADVTAALNKVTAGFTTAGLNDAEKWLRDRVLPKYEAARDELETLARTLTDLSKFSKDLSQSTDNTGKPLTKDEDAKARKEFETRFAAAEARDRARIEDARNRMSADIVNDQIAGTADPDKGRIDRLERFDSFDMFEKVNPLPKKADDWIKVRVAKEAADAIRAELATLVAKGPKNDQLFDVAAKSPADWRREIAEGMGLDLDDPTTDPSISEAVAEMTKAIMAEVQKAYPNKASDDMSSVTLNGKTYGKRQHLATGGGGTVSIYEDDQGGKIVLKEPKGYKPDGEVTEDKFEEFAGEARNQWEAIGGEKGPAPTNIMGMEGLVLGPNGQPLMAMPLADGGDAEGVNLAVNAAAQTGLISPQAQNAITQDLVRQMAMGIKQMQDKGISHHDLKEANVFVMGDGTVKIADFGLANLLDDHDQTVEMKNNTPGYEPEEFQVEGKLGEKSDNFTLGVILSKMTDPRRGFDTFELGYFNAGLTEQQSTAPDKSGEEKVIEATALDRLRNALLSPDAADRPEMTEVLLSSYLYEAETSYTEEDLAELRAASNAYAKTVGKKTGKIEREIQVTEADIRKLEMEQTGELATRQADYYGQVLAKTRQLIPRFQRELTEAKKREQDLRDELGDLADKPKPSDITAAKDDAERDRLTAKRQKIERELAANPVFAKKSKDLQTIVSQVRKKEQDLKTLQNQITTLDKKQKAEEAKQGVRKTPQEARELQLKLAEKRKVLIDLRKQIEALHNAPDAVAIVDRLKKANAAFL